MSRPPSRPRRRGLARAGAAALVACLALGLVVGCGDDPAAQVPTGSRPTIGAGSVTGSVPTGSGPPTTAPVPVACAPTDADYPTGARTPSGAQETIAADGVERTYILSAPATRTTDEATPVVFSFYGRVGDAADQVAEFELDDTGTAAGMIVVTPQAPPDRDPSENSWAGDEGLVDAIFASLSTRFCVDPARVYAAGFSDGGVFSAYLACRRAGTFAAIATVSEIAFPEACPGGDDAFSVIGFHGVADPLEPFGGGANDPADGRSGLAGPPDGLPPSQPVESVFAQFGALDGCRPIPSTTDPISGVQVQEYTACRPGLGVVLYALADQGHTWPGDPTPGEEAAGGRGTTDDVDANAVLLGFFAAHPRPR